MLSSYSALYYFLYFEYQFIYCEKNEQGKKIYMVQIYVNTGNFKLVW